MMSIAATTGLNLRSGLVDHNGTTMIEEVLATQERISTWHDVIQKIDDYLKGDHGLFEYDDYAPPSSATLKSTAELIKHLFSNDLAPPNDVVIDPDGCIILEQSSGMSVVRFVIWEDGEIELQNFDGVELISREEIDLSSFGN